MMQTDHVGGRVWAVGFSTKCSKDQTALYNTNNAIKRECKKGCIACGMRHAALAWHCHAICGGGVFTGKEVGTAKFVWFIII